MANSYHRHFASAHLISYNSIISMNVPKIEPIKVTEYETKQSTYPHCGKLPIRSIVLGPSGSGKTVLLTNLILDVYKGCFV